MTDLSGQNLGRYHLIEKIGEGGMAVVYKSLDTQLERYVAIKVIQPYQEHKEQFLTRFKREARSLAKLNHPNIIKILDFGEESGTTYLVLDLVEGETLRSKLDRPITFSEAIDLLIPIAKALGYAHSKGIVHRDIKPSNILIGTNGELMLSDFGIAKILQADETVDLTGQGVGIGTPEYMAPEQGMGELIDQRSDIYSLGVVFYEMVTGRKPYSAVTPMAVLHKQMSEPLPRPRSFNDGIPDEAEKILIKVLSKDPDLRYQSMEEFVLALEKVKSPESRIENKKIRGFSKIAIPLGILAVGILGWYAIWGNRSTLEPLNREPGSNPVSSSTYVFPGNLIFQDDFDGPELDPAKWRCDGNSCSSTKMEQSNGVLSARNESARTGTGLSIASIADWKSDQVQEISVGMMLHEFSGDSTTEIILQFNASSPGFDWYTSCNMGGGANDAYFLCKVITAGKEDYVTREVPVILDQWYRVKITVDPESMSLGYYLDDTWLGGYLPKNAVQISRADQHIGLGAYSNGTNYLVGYFDDLSVSATQKPETTSATSVLGSLIVFEDFNDGKIDMYGYSADSEYITLAEIESGNQAIKADNIERHDFIAFAIGDQSWKNYRIEYKVNFLGEREELCVLSRIHSSGTVDILCLSPQVLYLAYPGVSEWQQVINKYPPIQINAWHDVRIDTFMDTFQVFIDGKLWIDENSSSPSGDVQFAANGFSSVLIDDIVITELIGQQ